MFGYGQQQHLSASLCHSLVLLHNVQLLCIKAGFINSTYLIFAETIYIMTYVLYIHSILRWLILLFGLLAVLKAIGGITSKKAYTGSDNKTGLFFMIWCDIQLLLGLVLYFGGAWFDMMKSSAGEVMKNSANRFFAVEHALMMIIAWILVHMGRSMVKRADSDAQKHKRSLIYFGIALLIILAMIPWPFRTAGIGRQLFPQF